MARWHSGLIQNIAHLGHPWQRIIMAVLRENRKVFSDVSASWRPTDRHRGLIRAQEWGVVDKLLFGSDLPIWTPAGAIVGLQRLGDISSPTGAPTPAKGTLDRILNGDPRPALGVQSW